MELLRGLIDKLFSRSSGNRNKGRAVGEHFDASLSTHYHRDAHDRGPVVVPCRNGGHAGCGAVARLCFTLLRMTPRLRVLILISPFKFLWHDQRAASRPTFHPAVEELCSALAPAIHHRDPPSLPRRSSTRRDRREDDLLAREDRRSARDRCRARQMVDSTWIIIIVIILPLGNLNSLWTHPFCFSPCLILHCSIEKRMRINKWDLSNYLCIASVLLVYYQFTIIFVLLFLCAINKLEGISM